MLNIGAGKVSISDFPEIAHIVHLDGSYPDIPEHQIDQVLRSIQSTGTCIRNVQLCKADIFEFIDSWPFKFDHINADRIFEHMFYDSGEIGRLLDACNQITKDDGTMRIVVPNHLKLAKMLIIHDSGDCLDDPVKSDMFKLSENALTLMINTEFCNSSGDSHGSVWTPTLARQYINNEGGTWEINSINPDICLKGRNIYMEIELTK